MDPSARRVSVVSLLALVGALAGGWYGVWAKDAGFALSSVSWGFSVVLLPLAVAAGLALAPRAPRDAAFLSVVAQASMTLAFSVFSFALRSTVADLARVPWQVLVVLAGDVVVTTTGLALGAGGAAWVLARAWGR